MSTSYIVIAVLGALACGYAALVDFRRAPWVLDNMRKYGVPHSWLFTLGALKLAGAIGLLLGIAVRPIAVAAAIGLVVYFVGAGVTVVRARWYSHLIYPAPFLALSAAALAFAAA